jgi:ArsR family transcriptional regulator
MERLFSNEESMAEIAHALSHPVRLQILAILRESEAFVMHLTARLDRPQSNISQHLAILREAGLVTDERDGMNVAYHIRDPRLYEFLDRLEALAPEREGPHARRGPGHRHGRPWGECHCPRCSPKIS